MTNDELALKLSNLEGLITGMSKRFERVEESIEKVVSLDRSVAEINVRYENQQRDLRDLAHDIKNCQQHHKSQNELLVHKLDTVEKDYHEFKNKTAGVILGFKIFSGVVAAALVISGQWVYDRAEGNRMTNIEQGHELKNLNAQLAAMKGK